MLKKVKFVEEAALEFQDSVEWYESKVAGLGLDFASEISNAIEKIMINPDMYFHVIENIRRIQVKKFPYSIFYTKENETMVILRVFHNKRNPIKW